MTREALRLLFIEHRSRRAVAKTLGWSEWMTRRVFDVHGLRDWKTELTNAEIRAAWIRARRTVGVMAINMHIAPKTVRRLLKRIGVTPPGRGNWQRRERRARGPGRRRLPASSRTGRMGVVLATWPPLEEWVSPLLEVYYPVRVG